MAITDHWGCAIPARRHSSGLVFDGKPTIPQRNEKEALKRERLLQLIEEAFELSFRSQNCLRRGGIMLIGQLVQKTAPELLALKNFGRRSLVEIEAELASVGLALGTAPDFPPWAGDERDAELIRILGRQRVGGGFLGEPGVLPSANRGAALLRYSEQILQRLESEFLEGRPYLLPLIRRHRIWLQDGLRNASAK